MADSDAAKWADRLRDEPSRIYPIPIDYTPMLSSALAWAVGKLEGLGADTGYAGRCLERWENPTHIVEPKDPDA